MIIVLKNANFSASNIGTLSTWRIAHSIGTGAAYDGPTSIDKSAALSASVTLAEGYEIDATGVVVTMGGIALSDAYSIDGNVITITIASVTGNVLIKVPTVNTAGGDEPIVPDEPDTPVEPDTPDVPDAPVLVGYTAQTLDTSKYRLANLVSSGVNSEGSSTTALTYNNIFKVPNSGRIVITCPEGYYIKVRSGSSKTDLKENQFWFNSGDEIQIAGGLKKDAYFGFSLSKFAPGYSTGSIASPEYETITKDIVNNIFLYYKDEYTDEFVQSSNFDLVQTLSTAEADWKLASVTTSGYESDGSNTKRLAYGTPISSTTLHDNVLMITCDKDYLWACRVSGDGGKTYIGNMFWYHSGTMVRLSDNSNRNSDPDAEYTFIPIFAKMGTPSGLPDNTVLLDMTKAEAAAIAPVLYTPKSMN
jgi:hypothetical protein